MRNRRRSHGTLGRFILAAIAASAMWVGSMRAEAQLVVGGGGLVFHVDNPGQVPLRSGLIQLLLGGTLFFG